ncbi:MAG: response regulator [Alphaproteobacteria bacterium]|nr:response regulator [Alphaproteobacteria bacterium]
MLGDILDLAGYEFALVRNGAEMRENLDREKFDVAIVDISLRGSEDGFDLAKVVAARGCAVILTTGNPKHRPRLETSGQRHLFKPFRVQEMTELVDEVLSDTGALCEKRGGCDDPPVSAAA